MQAADASHLRAPENLSGYNCRVRTNVTFPSQLELLWPIARHLAASFIRTSGMIRVGFPVRRSRLVPMANSCEGFGRKMHWRSQWHTGGTAAPRGSMNGCHWLCQCGVGSRLVEGSEWQAVNEWEARKLLSRRIEQVPACTRPFPIGGSFNKTASDWVHVDVVDRSLDHGWGREVAIIAAGELQSPRRRGQVHVFGQRLHS